jgi:hypothetical protein
VSEIEVKVKLREWIEYERAVHASTKYSEGMDGRKMLVEAMKTEGWGDTWQNFAGNYLKRVELFGIDTPQGRQAMGKAIVTLMHCLETAMVVHGDLPKPGLTSGEIEEWK